MSHKEHFVAHHLLFEIYDRKGEMAAAFKMMMNSKWTSEYSSHLHRVKLGSWKYEHSEETRAKMSNSRLGNTNALGKKFSEVARMNMSRARLGNTNSLGHIHSEESRKKMSDCRRGEKNHFYCKSHSDEFKKMMSDVHKGKKKSEYLCPNCGKSGRGPVMFRFHFDNCKKKPE